MWLRLISCPSFIMRPFCPVADPGRWATI
jgi:hypothetical protein